MLTSIFPMGVSSGVGIDPASAPKITFDGKWSGWRLEFYSDEPYWEALFQSSGTLSVDGQYTADAWGIGGGGAGGQYYSGSYYYTGGGSGYTNMISGVSIIGAIPVSIGAGAQTQNRVGSANYTGADGGSTNFMSLTCAGGKGGAGGSRTGGEGGSNGSGSGSGGTNGSPGNGKIMSKFWSAEHNTEYGQGGSPSSSNCGGGGGGYMDFSGGTAVIGHGFGGGGCGGAGSTNSYDYFGFCGTSGCLIIRIKA